MSEGTSGSEAPAATGAGGQAGDDKAADACKGKADSGQGAGKAGEGKAREAGLLEAAARSAEDGTPDSGPAEDERTAAEPVTVEGRLRTGADELCASRPGPTTAGTAAGRNPP